MPRVRRRGRWPYTVRISSCPRLSIANLDPFRPARPRSHHAGTRPKQSVFMWCTATRTASVQGCGSCWLLSSQWVHCSWRNPPLRARTRGLRGWSARAKSPVPSSAATTSTARRGVSAKRTIVAGVAADGERSVTTMVAAATCASSMCRRDGVQETLDGSSVCAGYRTVQCFEYGDCAGISSCLEAQSCTESSECPFDACVDGEWDGERVPCQDGVCACLRPPSRPDAGPPDTGGLDGGPADAGDGVGPRDGCGCAAGGDPSGGLVIGLAVFAIRRRRRSP